MQINLRGIALIKEYEGLGLKAYICPAGYWTIGYGHTATTKPGQFITEEEATRLLYADVRHAENAVNGRVKVSLNSNQFSALCSFVFNVGLGNFTDSTLLKLLNRKWYTQVPAQLVRWNRAGGQILNGLTRRRAAEGTLWNTPDGGTNV